MLKQVLLSCGVMIRLDIWTWLNLVLCLKTRGGHLVLPIQVLFPSAARFMQPCVDTFYGSRRLWAQT